MLVHAEGTVLYVSHENIDISSIDEHVNCIVNSTKILQERAKTVENQNEIFTQ